MPRPQKCRRIGFRPGITFFKPAGVPVHQLETVALTLDETEAVRLGDLEGIYHEEAARRMNVSRQTFGNIIESARRKIADCVINGKALKIEGGNVQVAGAGFVCPSCGSEWADASAQCPKCGRETGHGSCCKKRHYKNLEE
ncbi:MAG: DUF134 domain-containing protein [Brevinematales bacterium]|nr:DUF134 domain-containing protein [Brevinematales bacterium]